MGGAGSTAAPERLAAFCGWETDGAEWSSPAVTSAAARAHLEPSAMHLRRKSISRGFLPLALMLRIRAARVNFFGAPSALQEELVRRTELFIPHGRFGPCGRLEANH